MTFFNYLTVISRICLFLLIKNEKKNSYICFMKQTYLSDNLNKFTNKLIIY